MVAVQNKVCGDVTAADLSLSVMLHTYSNPPPSTVGLLGPNVPGLYVWPVGPARHLPQVGLLVPHVPSMFW